MLFSLRFSRSTLIIGLMLVLCSPVTTVYAADCVTSPLVAQELDFLDQEINAAAQGLINKCKEGTVGRAEQLYYNFLSISVNTSGVFSSLKSIVDVGENHALSHDIREYETALERLDGLAKKAMQLCSPDLVARLTEIKKKYTHGSEAEAVEEVDGSITNQQIGGIDMLRAAKKSTYHDGANNYFFQREPFRDAEGNMQSAGYYEKNSPFACTLPRYGFAEFKTIFTSFLQNMKNFRTRADKIQPRSGDVLYQNFLVEQELMGAQDFYQRLQADTRDNQITDDNTAQSAEQQASDAQKRTADQSTTLSKTQEKMKKDGATKGTVEQVLNRYQSHDARAKIVDAIVDEDSAYLQYLNRNVGNRFLLMSGILSETDKILKYDLCQNAFAAANEMRKACEKISYSPGQVCDEKEAVRSCSP